MWILYELALLLGLLIYIPRGIWRRRLPHPGWSMRLGRYPEAIRVRRGQAPVIWVHAVSVGEVIAVRPLLHELKRARPGTQIVLSTVTPAGYDVALKLVGDHGLAVYSPLDVRGSVEKALDLIRPSALILVESELWPTLVRLAARRGVPIAVVNGRISPRAFGRYRLVKPALRSMLGTIELFLMQTDADAERIIAMGADPGAVRVLGSLKWDASLASRPSESDVARLAQQLQLEAHQPVIVAGSTHRGEEAALLQAFRGIRGHLDTARLIIAPRHRERLDEVEELVRRHGLVVERVTRIEQHGRPWDVALVDTMGQLPRFYALASVVFVGGSLIPHGGQNPLEPAGLGKAILFGPHMQNFADIAQRLLAAHAARQLDQPGDCIAALLELLTDPARTEEMGRRARELTERSAGVSRRTVEALTPLLTRPAATR